MSFKPQTFHGEAAASEQESPTVRMLEREVADLLAVIGGVDAAGNAPETDEAAGEIVARVVIRLYSIELADAHKLSAAARLMTSSRSFRRRLNCPPTRPYSQRHVSRGIFDVQDSSIDRPGEFVPAALS